MTAALDALAWVSRITGLISRIISLRIITNSNTNRKRTKQDRNNVTLPKYMRIYYVTAYCTVLLATVFWILRKINPICTYIYTLVIVSPMWPLIFLSFFQIGRLQLCFSASYIHSTFGYSKYVFIVEYSIGVVIFIASFITSFAKLEVYELPNSAGCSFISSPIFFTSTSLVSVSYILWDWSILFLYIFKIVQFKIKTKRRFQARATGSIDIVYEARASAPGVYRTKVSMDSKCTENDDAQLARERLTMGKIFRRTDIILKKILLLTLFVEVSYFVALFGVLLSSNDDDSNMLMIIQPILFNIHFATITYALYVMLEHNKSSYYKLLKILDWCHCCLCCLQTLYEDMSEQDVAIEIHVANIADIKEKRGKTGGVEANLAEVIAQNKRRGTIDTKTKTENQIMQNPAIRYEDPSRTVVAGIDIYE